MLHKRSRCCLHTAVGKSFIFANNAMSGMMIMMTCFVDTYPSRASAITLLTYIYLLNHTLSLHN